MKNTETFDPSAATPNVSKFGVSGGVAGLITTVVFVTIALIGLPIARGFLIGALLLGGGIAGGLRLAHRD
jgi:hypothetical protein